MSSGIFSVAARMKHILSPTPPPAGQSMLYFKDDGFPYCKDPAGVERPLIEIPSALHANGSFDAVQASVNAPNKVSANNSSMETDVSGWAWNPFWGFADLGTALTQSTLHPTQGTKSLEMTLSTTTKGNFAKCDVSGLEVGQRYVATMDVWVPTGSPDVALNVMDRGISAYTSTKNTTVTLSLQFTAEFTGQIVGILTKPAAGGEFVYADNLKIVPVKPSQWSDFWADATSQQSFMSDFVDKVAGASARIRAASGANNRIQTQAFGIRDTQVITFSVWHKMSNPSGVAQINFLSNTTEGGANYFSGAALQTAEFTPTTTWTKFTAVFNVPPGHLFARVDLVSAGVTTTGSAWWDESASTATETGGSTSLAVDVDYYESASTQALTSGTFAKVNGFSRLGTDPLYATLGTDTWTMLVAGTFLLTGQVEFNAGTSARRVLSIYINGVEKSRSEATTANLQTSQVTWVGELLAGDVVSVEVWTNTAGITLSAGAPLHGFQITPLKGPKGDAGTDGANGAPGSKWYNESPTTPTPPSSAVLVGDMFLWDNGDVSEYTATGWQLTSNIKGPAGTVFATKNEGVLVQSDTRAYNFVGDQVDAVTGPGPNDVTVNIQSVLPTGTMAMWPTITPPAGWLLCDGAAIPAAHTALITLIGANTPNLAGRFPLGAGTTQPSATVRNLGTNGGVDQVTLTGAQNGQHAHNVPAHNHTMAHTHAIPRRDAVGTSADSTARGGGTAVATTPTDPSSAANTGTEPLTAVSTNPTSATAPHENLPPYLAINFIIKT